MLYPDDDLFEIADALSGVLGAPVTIEDHAAAVIAYSDGQDAVDEARIETILDRRVPTHIRQALTEAGVFAEIARNDDVQFFDLAHIGMAPRMVMSVRDRGTLVGSIWVVATIPPTDQQRQILSSVAPVVARAMATARRRETSQEHHRTQAVEKMLEGGDVAARMAETMNFRAPFAVAAIESLDPGYDPTSAVNLHLSALVEDVICARVGSTVYAVFAAKCVLASTVLRDVQRRLETSGKAIVAGLGREVSVARDLDMSRSDADLLLQSMRTRAIVNEVGDPAAHHTVLLIDHVRSFVVSFAQFGPLVRLTSLDDDEILLMKQTVMAYLTAGGEIAHAARELHVHPNTVRNRIRRLRTVCDVDVEDPDTRLALWIELKASESTNEA